MSASPTLVVHRTVELLAEAAAARLLTHLVDVQSSGRVPSLVLTGGSIAGRVYSAVAASPARGAVDWSRVELWWGDERFLPAGDRERNETQARAVLLDSLRLDPGRVHPMPAADGEYAGEPEAAAAAYADLLRGASRPEDHADVPTFDLLLLGVGPDGHVASLFPEHPALYDERTVVAVHGAPKPPPTRVTLSMPALVHAQEVWFVVSGEDKARAVRMALSGAGMMQVPAAAARGRQRTLWLLDRDAAAEVPPGLTRIASP
ncbi:MAG: 6-phosphogluconolactonase [Propionibacteriales bacterium]|nr:6-phosphogluconolactonase [Propionibacteriales bacterium]